jgi:ATP-dependent exoDNAse (exonuclease V) beta subunit
MPVLRPDTALELPSLTVLRASAGSGKTYTLTERFAQFLLSPRVPRNDLACILALTFAKTAAREMREEILKWLKLAALGDAERLAALAEITAADAESLRGRATAVLEAILTRWSDFQVRTIDSFSTEVFRASAIDFGFGPDFEVETEPAPLLEYAFSLFLRAAREGTPEAGLLDRTVQAVLSFRRDDDAWKWDPAPPLLAEIARLEERLSRIRQTPSAEDPGPALREAQGRVRDTLEAVAALASRAGLDAHGNSTFPGLLSLAREGRFSDMIDRGVKNPPVKKPAGRDASRHAAYDEVIGAWDHARQALCSYAGLWARTYYRPCLQLRESLAGVVSRVKRVKGRVFIGDIARELGRYLSADMVPDVYFRLGERIFHFLLDEFQDTSPSQWDILLPLVENSLSLGGSLFVVGDTKQAIYGFRQADYTIMRGLEAANPFPSASHVILDLRQNRRSRPRIIDLVSRVFRQEAAASPQYREAARQSGLDAWTQEALQDEDPGYAEVDILARDEDDPLEKAKLQGLLAELHGRGYAWRDIALLSPRNEDVLRATAWLTESRVPVLSHSSLDVRLRRRASEVLSLLSFLDSPTDDLAFASFILGDLFGRAARGTGRSPSELQGFLFRCRTERPLYKAFQREFPDLWGKLLKGLFTAAGYLPPYDLVSEACAVLGLFDLAADEEATIARLLEKVKEFEGSGANSLRGFLDTADAEEAAEKWAIAAPRSADCVAAMTVHKSKGLGFPVVIVLLYGQRRRGFEYPVLEEPSGVSLVRLSQAAAGKDEELARLYDEETTRERVAQLNGLYVALTRARRELYVVGVKKEGDTFPFDILEGSGFEPLQDKGPPARGTQHVQGLLPTLHPRRTAPAEFSPGRLNREERRRGDLAHRMLSLVRAGQGDLEGDLHAAAERAGAEARDEAGVRDLAQACARLVRETDLGGYFEAAPGREVFTEQEFCDARGRLFRMDRVVVDPGRVTVIDYKTGPGLEQEHVQEVEGYARILEETFPGRSVEAILAYIDRRELRRVR